jgi:hypothetical protein
MHLVGPIQLGEQNGDLLPVRCGPRVKVEHLGDPMLRDDSGLHIRVET